VSLPENESTIIRPDWEAPAHIRALVTTRLGGVSQPPFESFNLAMHVDDKPENVLENRKRLAAFLPSEPVWLNQVHSNTVIEAVPATPLMDADGSFSCSKNTVCVVMTADCLPALITNRQGTAVAALHAGWRGLLDGILEQGAQKVMQAGQCQAEDLLVWLGPAIGPQAFEVGDEVRTAFLQKSPAIQSAIEPCFTRPETSHDADDNKWLADLYQLARSRLSQLGIENFSGGNYCTYNRKDIFYSYRRDGQTGRMASLIWIEA
jgi:YfiH family protein